MRGIFLKQPLEFRIEAPGDEWVQGEDLQVTLTVKNHSDAAQPLEGLFLYLALGNNKKVKEKSDSAFEIVLSADWNSMPQLDPGKENCFSWSFPLDKNCQISDKAKCLYLVCGVGDLGEAAGNLPVNIKPHAHIQAIQVLFESSFSFLMKGQKSKKGWVETKLKPPSGMQFPTLEYLMLSCCFDEDILLLQYCFHVKKLEATSSSLEYKKAKEVIEQKLNSSDYLLAGDFINNKPIEAAIKEALEVVESKF